MAGTDPPAQRHWRAACPGCGAPVDFRSAASVSAVCSFCRSTLVRDGEALRRIGQSAELFDDHSPLQLGVTGRLQGVTFTLVGRLQYATEQGIWNEWHALFDNGRTGWLSEDNGAYVLAFDAPLPSPAPALDALKPGQRVVVGGLAWDVASVVQARLLAAQGELPRPPGAEGAAFTVADLRNAMGEVATLEGADPAQPGWSVGRSASLSALALQGLREDAPEATMGSRGLSCPSCGAALTLQLASTKSLTCGQCDALIDVSEGVGAAVLEAQQAEAGSADHTPRIPLGRTGRLAADTAEPLDWQVVGYQEREDIPDDGEAPTPWSEYLLYHRTAGFAFLVDTAEGWSVVRPLTGVPQLRGERATWQDKPYRRMATYPARVTWVAGEFYWRVVRDERATVSDYVGEGKASGRLLSREETAQEVTWSAGRTLTAQEVQAAFRLDDAPAPAATPDVRPLSSSSGMGVMGWIILLLILLAVVVLIGRCSSDDCDSVRDDFGADSAEFAQCRRASGSGGGRIPSSSGGSYGGYSSSGGGHK